MVKNPPANAGEYEIQVRSLGREDHLEKEMATAPLLVPGQCHGRGGTQSQTQLSD